MKFFKFYVKIFFIFILFGFLIQLNAQKNNSTRILEFKKLFPDIDKYIIFPTTIRVDNNGNYYILDKKQHCIKVFDSNFKYSHQIGEVGQGKGELYYPKDFCMDKSQIIYIADTVNKRIQYFTHKGEYLGGFNLKYRPRAIQINSKGEIYISNHDLKNNTIISVYDKKGKVLRSFGDVEKTEYKEDLIKIVLNYVHLYIDEKDSIYLAFKFLPAFRKYNSSEKLVFEKEVIGSEMEKIKKRASIPVANPKKGTVSNVSLLIRGITVNENKNILIALTTPYVYLYDQEGKIKMVYTCFFNNDKICLYRIFYFPPNKIIAPNPFTNCVISYIGSNQ
jgi:hypothetical protein